MNKNNPKTFLYPKLNFLEMKNGDKVKVEYTGTLDDGSVFDSSEGRVPLEFIIGNGEVISGFENGIKDMKLIKKRQ